MGVFFYAFSRGLYNSSALIYISLSLITKHNINITAHAYSIECTLEVTMRLIVIKGDITGSIMTGKRTRIKLSKRLDNGAVILANHDDMRMYPMSGDSIDVTVGIDVDRCMIMDSREQMIGFGSCIGGVDRKAMLEAYYAIKRASLIPSKPVIAHDNIEKVQPNNMQDKNIKVRDVVITDDVHSCKIDDKSGSTSTDPQKSNNIKPRREGIYIKADEGYDNAINFASKVMTDKGMDVAMGATFYHTIHSDIDSLFEMYPHNTQLEEIVFDSTWVNVDCESKGEYAVGVIRDDGVPSVIVFGVPKAEYAGAIVSGYDWLPLDKTNPNGRGYLVAYQDAVTGEMLQNK